ncbi:MAG: bifunctional demethylmenaquinone methyltransferase/2-methoxy-6-polyprenyl-1,4-benzoquinol methylase UbiE [Bacteroidota bacterium]
MGVTPYRHTASGKKEQVERMFDNIAPKYDFMNGLLSAGIHKRWRKKAISLLREKKPKIILDLATGTGDFAIEAIQLNPDKVIAADISEGMMKIGREKIRKKKLEGKISFQKADSENLPFASDSFDAITVGFGVRNFEDLLKGLQGMHRVLKPGGMAVILEFSKVTSFPMKQLYGFYFNFITPALGKLFTSDRSAYTYLPDSVQAFPSGRDFELILQKAGFKDIRSKRLTFGIATIYLATK